MMEKNITFLSAGERR